MSMKKAMMGSLAFASVAALAGVFALLAAPTAQAGYRHHRHHSHAGRCAHEDCAGVYRFVRAESQSSFRSVVAPVRHGPVGDQVLVPGGSWHDCEISCEYTLQRVYLDFWEAQTDKGLSPGYFVFEFSLD